MRHPYRPPWIVPFEKSGMTREIFDQVNEQHWAEYVGREIEWEIIETVLPVCGGRGWKCQFYERGQPIDSSGP